MAWLDNDTIQQIRSMTENNHSVSEIRTATKCCAATIRKYQRQFGHLTYVSKGGNVARTLLIPPFAEDAQAKDERRSEEETPAMLITAQRVELTGMATMFKYIMDAGKKTITIEGEGVLGEIEIEKLLELAKEIKEVHKMANKLTSNKFGVFEG